MFFLILSRGFCGGISDKASKLREDYINKADTEVSPSLIQSDRMIINLRQIPELIFFSFYSQVRKYL